MADGGKKAGFPKVVLVFSGKRKSGKDYVTNLLEKRVGSHLCAIVRLSGPLKEQYAKEHNLDYSRLLDASDYKEYHRADMIHWGEDMRNKDPGYFCRHAIIQSDAQAKPVWLISDARRKTDIDFFKNNYCSLAYTIRICASEQVRISRGWVFTNGVDDAESECGLDDITDWDFVITNNDTNDVDTFKPLISLIFRSLEK